MGKPKVFVGSSTEGHEIAEHVQTMLEPDARVQIWSQGVFGLGQAHLESLVSATLEHDFAIMVLVADDLRESRGETAWVPRDNVLFELGLFMGRLGRERTLILSSDNRDIRFPSDLLGVNVAKFQGTAKGIDQDALRKPILVIRDRIRKLGTFDQRLLDKHPLATSIHGVVENTFEALTGDVAGHNKAFRDEIRRRVEHWIAKSQQWRDGRVYAFRFYVELLNEVYRTAKSSIFSTSVPDYNSAWDDAWGIQLLNIQQGNRSARSQRVFVLRDRTALDATAMRDMLKRHLEHGVDVWCYFGDQPNTIFPAEYGSDWTIVDDGRAIGVTRRFGKSLGADWFFDNETEGERFRQMRDNLLRSSERWRPS